MSEPYVHPETGLDFDQPPYRGTMLQLLSANIGKPVRIDFHFDAVTASYTGVIDSVGTQYVTLYQASKNCYVACDVYAVKFVTFLAG